MSTSSTEYEPIAWISNDAWLESLGFDLEDIVRVNAWLEGTLGGIMSIEDTVLFMQEPSDYSERLRNEDHEFANVMNYEHGVALNEVVERVRAWIEQTTGDSTRSTSSNARFFIRHGMPTMERELRDLDHPRALLINEHLNEGGSVALLEGLL